MSTLDVSTVFLSRRKGALLLRMEPDDGAEMTGMASSGNLSYKTPEGELVEQDIEAAYNGEPLDERGQYFEQAGVGKTVALAVLVSSMRQSAELYSADREMAIAIMTGTLARISADAQALNDETLDPEVNLARDMLRLMEQGAEQGDLYGSGFGS